MATITLPNGTIIEASDALVEKFLKGSEDGIHYNSASRGRIKISEMATPHIRNACLKLLREELDKLKTVNDEAFVNAIQKGVLDSPTLYGLAGELTQRLRPF